MLAAAAITLTTLAAKAPEAVFLKARNLVAEATDPVEGLSAAIAAIKGAQESCSADKEADAPLRRVLDQTLAGYERRHSLATVKPQPMSKLLKAQKSAQKKVKSLREDLDGDELQSKEDKAALKKLEEAEQKAGEAIEFARAVERVTEGRNLSASFSSQAILARHKAGTLQGEIKVLSSSPLVLTLDNWLGPAGVAALDDLPAVLEKLTAWPTAPADWSEEEDGVWQPDKKEAGELCVGKDEEGQPQAKMLQALDKAIEEAKAAAKKGKPHCAATAQLSNAMAEYGGATGCGTLTKGLEAAMAGSDAAWMIINSNWTVDVLDASVGGAVGFPGVEAEALFDAMKVAMTEHDDPATLEAPEGWDAEEDGEWAPSKVAAETYMGAMAAALKKEKDAQKQDGLGAAYAFSSSPELLRYRSATGGGSTLHLECADFANEKPAAVAAVAYLYATDVKKGGEDVFPALGVKVQPKKGRLLLVETMLADGTCDPSTATLSTAVKDKGDKLLLAKRFYSDTTFDRGHGNNEMPNQPPPKLTCDDTNPFGCQRRAPAGTPDAVPGGGGDAVMAARGFKQQPDM